MSNEKRAAVCAAIISVCIIFIFGITIYSMKYKDNRINKDQIYIYKLK